MDFTKEPRGEIIVEFLERVEQSGKWPQQACTMMFFLIPKTVTSERPIALMPTLIRWWEALRAPEVAKWQQKYRVDWDATYGEMEELSVRITVFCSAIVIDVICSLSYRRGPLSQSAENNCPHHRVVGF